MTQIKFNQPEKPKVKDKDQQNGKEEKEKPLTYINEKRIRLCAWILLTVGLCIIVTTFYLAIYRNPYYEDDNGFTKSHEDDSNHMGVHLESVASVIVGDDRGDKIGDELGDEMGDEWSDDRGDEREDEKYGAEPNKNGRITVETIIGAITKNTTGCQEHACQVSCSNVENVYLALHETLKLSSCPSIDVITLDKQDFPWGIVKNLWMLSNLSVHEVVLKYTSIRKIKDNAFNSRMYRNTVVMSWSQVTIIKVESGALLGLYKLKYLTIDGRVRQIEPALFQPVQNTLTHLKLNANMKINGDRNFFGVSYMNYLEYLDMSHNLFNCSLTKKFFDSTPNLKYLLLVNSQITHIEKNTFKNLTNKLLFINLSKNLLTTLAAEVIKPILLVQKTAMISLCSNDWNCNCELQELADLYKLHRIQFMETVYCKSPNDLYGVAIDEVNFEICYIDSSTIQDTVEEREVSTVSAPTEITTSKQYVNTPGDIVGEKSSEILASEENTTPETSTLFKMRCFATEPISSASLYSGSSSSSSASLSLESKHMERNLEGIYYNDVEYLEFPAPKNEFELQLLPENNSVIVTVQSTETLYIIWFSEQNSETSAYNSVPFHDCMEYNSASMIVGPLEENYTYTFCLVASNENSITPFDCLPLHVPFKEHENIWISEDNKEFTIGMLCLIFLLSTIAGALIAYFGIKTYPDLLEGSKNVLIVKKSDQACYVSTISETEYQKQSSLKKKKPSTKEKSQLKKQSSIKAPLPATPCSETPPPPFNMSVKDLERLSSLKSSSTCFEDTFPGYSFQDDEYETPKVCGNEYTIEQRSVPNKYGKCPRSPPPLPKRNSNVSDSPTVVMNRFSNKFE